MKRLWCFYEKYLPWKVLIIFLVNYSYSPSFKTKGSKIRSNVAIKTVKIEISYSRSNPYLGKTSSQEVTKKNRGASFRKMPVGIGFVTSYRVRTCANSGRIDEYCIVDNDCHNTMINYILLQTYNSQEVVKVCVCNNIDLIPSCDLRLAGCKIAWGFLLSNITLYTKQN